VNRQWRNNAIAQNGANTWKVCFWFYWNTTSRLIPGNARVLLPHGAIARGVLEDYNIVGVDCGMKIAIWDHYGGFVLPQKVLEYLRDVKHWSSTTTIRIVDTVKTNYSGVSGTLDIVDDVPINKYSDLIDYSSIPEPVERLWAHEMLELNSNKWCNYDVELRINPDVIEAIETIGAKHIKILDIPDDVDFYIDEYENGSESVHERHRIWS